MAYDLFIGDRMFSSWSLRGWLMFEKFSIPCRTHMVGLYSGTMARDMADLFPARLVPAVRTPEGTVIGESLAIAETLAERHPEAGLWPSEPSARATARWLCAEMVAGFTALRGDCPMQFLHLYKGFQASPEVLTDLARMQTLWAHARAVSGSDTPWLMGRYCLADVFFGYRKLNAPSLTLCHWAACNQLPGSDRNGIPETQGTPATAQDPQIRRIVPIGG